MNLRALIGLSHKTIAIILVILMSSHQFYKACIVGGCGRCQDQLFYIYCVLKHIRMYLFLFFTTYINYLWNFD